MSKTEAPGQTAGYLYQLRYALFRALERLRRDPTASIGIERLDDISIVSNHDVVGLEQLKHSTSDAAVLSDHSPGLWRTLAIWSDLTDSNQIDLSKAELVLVTTAEIAADSGLSKLGPDEMNRDPPSALVSLKEVATVSKNKLTAQDRQTFLQLDPVLQAALVRSIRAVPGSPNVGDLTDEIEVLLHYACESAQLPDFRAEIEGWWIDKVSSALSLGRGPLVPLTEIDARVSYQREKYKLSNLEFEHDDIAMESEKIDDLLFMKQMRLVRTSDGRIRNAHRNFLRASAQRSKWLRQARMDPSELNQYDQELSDRWTTQAQIAFDELADGTDESEKCKAGRALLGWAEGQEIPLRGAAAHFLTSGSYHSLADQLVVGWHPEFKSLLS